MSVLGDLAEHLENDTELNSLIADRIYPVVSKGKFPCIRYQVISDKDSQELGGKVSYSELYIQIDCYSKSYLNVKEIASALKKALYSFEHFPYDLKSRDAKDIEENTKLFRELVEFKFNF